MSAVKRRKVVLTPEERLQAIAEIIEGVDNRALWADGPVTPTLEEIRQSEMTEIYRLATGKAVPKTRPLTQLERALYWLIQLHNAPYRQGWEEGPTEDDLRRNARLFLIGECRIAPDVDMDKAEPGEDGWRKNYNALMKRCKGLLVKQHG